MDKVTKYMGSAVDLFSGAFEPLGFGRTNEFAVLNVQKGFPTLGSNTRFRLVLVGAPRIGRIDAC
jgi:hypothetical protein